MVKGWTKRLMMMRISKYILIITLSASLVFAGFTVYGAQIGNFNIYTQEGDIRLALYMKEDRSDLGTHLSVPVLDNMKDTTFEDMAVQNVRSQIMNGLGPKNDNAHTQYMAFSVVLINLSDKMVNYTVDLTVIASSEGRGGKLVENAMRVLVVTERGYDKGSIYDSLETDAEKEKFFRNGKIYAMPEESEENKQRLEENTHYQTEDFISRVQLLHQEEFDLEINEEVKYTVLIWLEGWDADCVNDLFGGKIKMRMDFAGQ